MASGRQKNEHLTARNRHMLLSDDNLQYGRWWTTWVRRLFK